MPNNSSLSVFTSSDLGQTFIVPLTQESIALRTTTVAQTGEASYRIPRITADPSADWVAEGDEIPASEATGSEVLVTPKKLSGISFVSNELAADSSPSAVGTVGGRLVADSARKVDAAFFGAWITDDEDPLYNPERPAGLESINLANLSRIDANPTTSIDAWIDALAAAEAEGATLTSWVTTPAIKAAIQKLKTATGSNSPLLGAGADNGVGVTVLGLPLIASPYVTAGSVWGLPAERIVSVLRSDVKIDVDTSMRFQNDQTAIRSTMRLAWGFPHAKAIALIRD